MLKRLLKILQYTILSLVGLAILLVVLVHFTPVQNFITKEVTKRLSRQLNTTISLDHIELRLLNQVVIEGFYVADQNKDTLLYAGEVQFRITDWFIFREGVPVIKYIGLRNSYAHLYRKRDSNEWNYQFIADAFASDSPKQKKDTSGGFQVDLKEVDLQNVRFHMDDAWVGSDMNFDVGSFYADARKVDLDKKEIIIKEITAKGTRVVMRDYDGGRPPKPKDTTNRPEVIDTTAFNPGNFAIKVNDLTLEDCFFSLDVGTDPALKNEFDPEHIGISKIMLDAENIVINGDTLTARMANLAAVDRSGLAIKKMQADVRVSPNESVLDDLLLETNNSVIRDHYSMHYERFPDFNDYIDKVVMVAHLKKSEIDSRDVAYFATMLREYPTVLNISGDIKGTVADFTAKGLDITDGYNTVKGNLTMKGLPDIDETYIDFNNGQVFTSGAGIFKYAPGLRTDSTIAFGSIEYAYFNGDFSGYITNFSVDGTLRSNLGTIVSDVKMNFPESQNKPATYAGNVKVNTFNLGALLRESDLGTFTLTANIKGKDTRAKYAEVEFDAVVEQIEYKGYNYRDIKADGVLEQHKFTGNLLINDPNLVLGFYGAADFSKGDLVKINATANLLKSNLTALNLVKKDTITLVADFDMNFEGESIDEFTGYARLYNIDLNRNNQLLDLDSVNVTATEEENGYRQMTVKSNAVHATMRGDYQLSTLHHSFQYYIAGYLPNYINAPTEYAPEQDITFTVKTYDLDNLFSFFVPGVSGFDNAVITGHLATQSQSLKLNAKIPTGVVEDIQFDSVSVLAKGDLNSLAVNVDIGKVIFPDTSMNGTVSITTTLGNDKLDFNIATTSPNTFGMAVLKGSALAHGDTLNVSFAPSEFVLADTRWEIPAKNKIVYTDGYIDVDDLTLQSGKQRITIYSNNNGLKQRMYITAANLEMSQIAGIAGLGEYDVKGRLGGEIKIEDPFTNIMVSSDIQAIGVKFEADTIGAITVAGSYDGKKRLVNLDSKTGIYLYDRSLTASGKISFNSENTENIDGVININNAPLTWASPALAGFVSNISGSLNGQVTIKGTSSNPDIKGKVNLDDAGMHVDFLGTNYSIRQATITVNDREISLGNLTLYDEQNNTATLSGGITHNNFKNMRLNISANSDKIQAIDLASSESDVFYGDLVAGFRSLTIRGPFDDIALRITGARPAARSHLFLPIGTDNNEMGAYSYISFRKDSVAKIIKAAENKLSINITAEMDPMAKITMVMDPATGDAINARGTGTISMEIPPNNDIRMFGSYIIEDGDYTFTLPQLFFKRKFILNSGSQIIFAGPIENTRLNVQGIYRTRARLYDLLTENEKNVIAQFGEREVEQAKVMREIDVLLFMKGSLNEPELDFRIEVPDKSATNNIAYKKLETINQNERELFDQVASLLLINSFMPAGGFEGGASSGVVNNVSDIFSGTASSQLTNLISKLTGNEDLAIDLKYQKYDYSATGNAIAGNRNAVSLGITQNLFNDRLTVEVGSSLDWGKPTSSNNNASYFNPVGDFRLQYQLKEGGNVRANVFRTSNYDVLADQNITRGGVGLSWRKSFDNLQELFGGVRYLRRKEEEERKLMEQLRNNNNTSTDSNSRGTN